MKKKRLLSLLLALSMTAAVSTSCSSPASTSQPSDESKADTSSAAVSSEAEPELPDNFNPTDFPIVNEKITLKMVGMTNPNLVADWADSDFFQSMEEKTNIAFEFYTIPNTAWSEKFNLLFVSDDLPDVFFRSNMNLLDIADYTEQGYLIDLKPLIDAYGPNVSALLENDDFRTAVTMPDGRIPTLPQISAYIPLTPLWLNHVWLEELGLSQPTNADELYEVLKAFKEQDPNGNGIADEIPLSFGDNNGGIGLVKSLMGYFGLYFVQNDTTNMFVDPETGELVFGPETEEFKEALTFLRTLYSEQLLDNEVFTQQQAQVKAKGSEETPRLGGFLVSSPVVLVGGERLHDYSIPPVPVTESGEQYWVMQKYAAPGKFAITNKNQYPEATIRWIDYLYSEEGGSLLWRGEEGKGYVVNEDGSWSWNICEGEDEMGHRSHVSMQPGGSYAGLFPEESWYDIDNDQEQYLLQCREITFDYLYDPLPTIYYSREDSKQLTTYSTDLNTYINQAIAQFITGEMSLENDWDAYLATLEQMGSPGLKQIVSDNYAKIK